MTVRISTLREESEPRVRYLLEALLFCVIVGLIAVPLALAARRRRRAQDLAAGHTSGAADGPGTPPGTSR